MIIYPENYQRQNNFEYGKLINMLNSINYKIELQFSAKKFDEDQKIRCNIYKNSILSKPCKD